MRLQASTLLRTGAIAAVMASATAGCGVFVPEPASAEAPADCLFPAGTVLAFAGPATLKQAGLEPGLMTEDVRGELYVTANRISIPQNDQNDLHRRYCMVYPPGAAMSMVNGLVPDAWAPPEAP